MRRRAKIVATVGPASYSTEVLQKLVEAGVDVVRINFSHGTHEEHAQAISRIREIAPKTGRAVSIMQDLQGPKLRTGSLAGNRPVQLSTGDRLKVTTHPTDTTASTVYVGFPDLPKVMQPGGMILLDDGRIELRVTSVEKAAVDTEVVTGGVLGSHKGVNLPGLRLPLPPLTSKDLDDLAFGLNHGVDAVAMSFVRQPADLVQLKKAIQQHSPSRLGPTIIAKLERPEALEHLEGILEEADGVMVARGDLGVELPAARVPSIQKRIIDLANRKHRIVITATEMLESMISNSRPTRAEASDVANAVFDGSDDLMLSGETAIGQYPVRAVSMMADIIMDAEANLEQWGRDHTEALTVSHDDAQATTHAARFMAHDRDVTAIAVFTTSGRTARMMSKARPRVPIIGFTPEPSTYNRLAMLWGVAPMLVPRAYSVDEMIERVELSGLQSGLLQDGDQVVLVASLPVGAMGPPNFVLLHTVGDRGKAS